MFLSKFTIIFYWYDEIIQSLLPLRAFEISYNWSYLIDEMIR